MKILDLYIIRKFLGTFFFSIVLIMMIVVVFDVSEKLGDFIDKKAPLREIIFDYYMNFVPYFANRLSHLFVFISVIYFTSRMASRTEIVAMLSSGISFNRIVFVPYLIAATILVILSLYLNNYVIPHANKKRLAFEEAYIRDAYSNREINIHRQIQPGTTIYFNSFNVTKKIGHQFSMEKIKDGERYYYLKSDYIVWDSIKGKWTIHNYFIREINGLNETTRKGFEMDTLLNFMPADFARRTTNIETMNYQELNAFIQSEKEKGSQEIDRYEVERNERLAYPFATFVLMLIGVSLASRKVRGGIGLHIGLGIGLSFTYIMFMQVSSQLAIKGGFSPAIAMWTPNILFTLIAIYLLRKAPK